MKNSTISKTGPGKFRVLSLFAFALFFSFHLMTGGPEFLEIMKNNFNYFSSPLFFLKLSLIAGLLWAVMMTLSYFYMKRNDEKKDRQALLAAASLLALDFLMAYLKYYDRTWLALYGMIFAAAVFALFIRTGAFAQEGEKPGEKWPAYTLAAAAIAIAVLGIIRGFSFHDSFFTMAKDLGVLVNSIWRAGQDGSQFTYFDGYRDQRGAHFQPIIYLFALLFKISCSPHALLFLQVIFSVSAVIFLYLLAEKHLADRKAAFLLSLAFLAGTYTARTFVYDFHFDSMYMACFFAFLYFAGTRRFVAASAALLLALAVKEEAAVYMALAAVFVYTRSREKKYLLLAGVSAAYAAAVIGLLIPAHAYQNGTFAEQVLENFSSGFMKYLTADMAPQLAVFLLSAALLPFLAPAAFLFLLAPPAAVHSLMYVNSELYLFDVQYASFVTPPLFAATIYALAGSAWQKEIIKKHLTEAAFLVFLLQAQAHLSYALAESGVYKAAAYIITVVLAGLAFFSGSLKPRVKYLVMAALCVLVFYAGYFKFYEWRLSYVDGAAKDSIKAAMKLIPVEGAPAVVTNTNIAPHLCCRKYIFAMELSTPEEIYTYLHKDGVREFYLLIYFKDFTYGKLEPAARTKRIFELGKKLGYTGVFLYNDGITMLARFLQ